MGDFNAHIGALGGPKGVGEQGALVEYYVDRCFLHVMSLSERAGGPSYGIPPVKQLWTTSLEMWLHQVPCYVVTNLHLIP